MAELFDRQPPTQAQMIAAVEREITMRRRVYPGRIAEKKMTQERADHEIACMEGVLAILQAPPGGA